MLHRVEAPSFPSINPGYDRVFRPRRLSVGLVVPIEAYPSGPVPTMGRHVERAQLAESLGFSALWLRDIPLHVPSFGDAGQTYDPWVYLGLLAGQTQHIALGVASIVLPLRHPVHTAKAAASVDALSQGRLILGVASGDRPDEYPVLGVPFEQRGAWFRERFDVLSRAHDPAAFGNFELLPRPPFGRVPLLVTGGSQQSPDWIANHGDGWMVYPRRTDALAEVIRTYRERVDAAGRGQKPVMQPLYVDLADDPDAPPQPIHLGFRSGTRPLRSYLESLEAVGVNHVALNLRFHRSDIETTLRRLADDVLVAFAG